MNTQSNDQQMQRLRVLALIPFGIALNLALGTVVATLKIPLYLDSIATIAVTLLGGWRPGLVVGVGSFLVGGMLINPVLPWFSGTQVIIALYISFVASKGWLGVNVPVHRIAHSAVGFEDQESLVGNLEMIVPASRLPKWLQYMRLVGVGLCLGVVAGVVSAPVIVWLFSGLTGSGPSLVVAFLLKSGETLFKAVLFSGLASEPLDKTLQLLIAIGLLRSLPNSLKRSFGGPHLDKNGLIRDAL